MERGRVANEAEADEERWPRLGAGSGGGGSMEAMEMAQDVGSRSKRGRRREGRRVSREKP